MTKENLRIWRRFSRLLELDFPQAPESGTRGDIGIEVNKTDVSDLNTRKVYKHLRLNAEAKNARKNQDRTEIPLDQFYSMLRIINGRSGS